MASFVKDRNSLKHIFNALLEGKKIGLSYGFSIDMKFHRSTTENGYSISQQINVYDEEPLKFFMFHTDDDYTKKINNHTWGKTESKAFPSGFDYEKAQKQMVLSALEDIASSVVPNLIKTRIFQLQRFSNEVGKLDNNFWRKAKSKYEGKKEILID